MMLMTLASGSSEGRGSEAAPASKRYIHGRTADKTHQQLPANNAMLALTDS